jgi:hypothetical protein
MTPAVPDFPALSGFPALPGLPALSGFPALLFLSACASVAPPPGGPEDHAPPEIVSVSVDTNTTNFHAGKIEVVFDEVISEHPSGISATAGSGGVSLDNAVLISPRSGGAKVSWHRDRITIEPRRGFKANTAYRITLLPGIADIRGNVRREAVSFSFTTGATMPTLSIPGRMFDWELGAPVRVGIVEATKDIGTPDSLTFVAFVDSSGAFDVGPLGPGTYRVRGFIDTDGNQQVGILEKWDTTTVTLTDHSQPLELLAIQRDSASVGIQRVDVMDSSWIKIVLDKPYAPSFRISPAILTLQQEDSTKIPLQGVMTEAQADSTRPKSAAPKDTTIRSAVPPLPVPRPLPDTISTRPPAPKPSRPAPLRAIVAHLSAGARLVPGARYVVTIHDIPNLVGRVASPRGEFVVPKPPPPPKPPG